MYTSYKKSSRKWIKYVFEKKGYTFPQSYKYNTTLFEEVIQCKKYLYR